MHQNGIKAWGEAKMLACTIEDNELVDPLFSSECERLLERTSAED